MVKKVNKTTKSSHQGIAMHHRQALLCLLSQIQDPLKMEVI